MEYRYSSIVAAGVSIESSDGFSAEQNERRKRLARPLIMSFHSGYHGQGSAIVHIVYARGTPRLGCRYATIPGPVRLSRSSHSDAERFCTSPTCAGQDDWASLFVSHHTPLSAASGCARDAVCLFGNRLLCTVLTPVAGAAKSCDAS